MGVAWPMITENSCNKLVLTTEHPCANMLINIMDGMFPSQVDL